MKTCNYCDREFEEDVLTQIGKEFVCDDCIDVYFTFCEYCEQYVDTEKASWVDGKNICDDCFADNTFTCEECTETHLIENANETRDGLICNDCFEYNYCCCDDCGDMIERDSAYFYGDRTYCSYCYDCFMESIGVHDHDYTPNICFHECDDEDFERSNNLHVGIELEIQGCRKDNFCLEFKDHYEDEDIFYMKEDGSLEDAEGVEIVSQPMTYNFIKNTIHFPRLFKLLEEYDMNNTSSCGLHFHLDREYCEKDNKNIGSVIDYIVNMFSDFFENVGGRDFNGYCKKSEDKKFEDWGKRNFSRYYAVNFENSNTIELRFCKSTSDYKTFMNRVKMIFTIVCFAQKYNLKDVSKMTQNDFVKKFKRIYKQHFGNYNN